MPHNAARIAPTARPAEDCRPDDEPWVALHPMHQRLITEFGASPAPAMVPTPAKRMAAVFYVGLGGWAMVGASVWAVAKLF